MKTEEAKEATIPFRRFYFEFYLFFNCPSPYSNPLCSAKRPAFRWQLVFRTEGIRRTFQPLQRKWTEMNLGLKAVSEKRQKRQRITEALKNQRPLRSIRGLAAKMFNLFFIAVSEGIKTQTVKTRIHNFAQRML